MLPFLHFLRRRINSEWIVAFSWSNFFVKKQRAGWEVSKVRWPHDALASKCWFGSRIFPGFGTSHLGEWVNMVKSLSSANGHERVSTIFRETHMVHFRFVNQYIITISISTRQKTMTCATHSITPQKLYGAGSCQEHCETTFWRRWGRGWFGVWINT